MKRPTFAYGERTMFAGVIKERDVHSAIKRIRLGEYEGARGFDLHIPLLEPEERTPENLKKIISSTDLPILALNYNVVNFSDEERMETLIKAVEAGAAAADMQGYTFDRAAKDGFVDDEYIPEGMEFLASVRPKEVALKPEVIAKQKAFIDRIHDMGAEVLASVHFGTVLSKEQLAAVARFARAKGADIVKMVAVCSDRHQVPGAIESTVYLKDELDFPFSYHMNGKYGIITRQLLPLFGSHIAFCNVDYNGVGVDTEQLNLRSIVDAYRALGKL